MASDEDRDRIVRPEGEPERDAIIEPDREPAEPPPPPRDDDEVVAPDGDPSVIRPAPDRGGNVAAWLIGLLVLIGLIILALLVWAALDDEEDTAGADVGVTINDVVEDTETYIGVPVTVSGEVNEVIAPNAFTIGGEGFIGGSELLIVGAEGVIELPEGFEREEEGVLGGDIVQATGPVVEFDIVEVEEELGVDLDDELFEDYEGDAAIMATRVTTSPRLADLPPSALNIEQILEDEEAFIGEEVTLNGEVTELIGPQAFLMRDAQEEDQVFAVNEEGALLVIAPEDMISGIILEDIPVIVTGEVRVLAVEDEEELEEDFGFDIDDTIFDTFEDQPVLIATAIEAGTAVDVIEIERIATDALAYLGQEVTTGGTVEEVIGDQAFVLTTDEDDEAIVDVEVLVVGATDIFTDTIVEDAFVQVTGEVFIFDAEFEEEFGDEEEFGFLFEDEEFEDFEDGIVIVAESMEVVR